MSNWYDAYTTEELLNAKNEMTLAIHLFAADNGLIHKETINHLLENVISAYIKSVAHYNEAKPLFEPFNNHLKATGQRNRKCIR